MKVEQIYTGCLAQGAYYIESEGEAAVVDPLREVKPYIKKAEQDGAKIKYILETHFHADFVSGHLDLAKASGAEIVYGPLANPNFGAHIAKDEEVLSLGKAKIKVLHTPGHTMESTCYLLIDEEGKEQALFTGDTLFIGDVGRPDLAQKAAHMTQEELAATLYKSLRTKVMTLSNEVVVYPGHGAGSACGKHMSKETVSTIGAQKQTNYALREDMSEEEFVKEVTDGLLPPPAYFPMNVRMNKEGYESIDEVLSKGIRPLNPEAFEAAANETGALILDTRDPDVFGEAFIPNAINIGLGGQFAPWAGALIPEGQAILLLTDEGKEEEAITRLARVGYDNTLGYLQGGIKAWKDSGKEVDAVDSVNASDFAQAYKGHTPVVIDVRKPNEYASEHVEKAINLPLDYINEHLAEYPKDETFYLHCAGGYRSMIAASILKSRGWNNFINVKGGFADISKTDVARTDYVCPSTLK
ncbi:MBL fold metallo-hydrolase [Porifericola rhodea]|uniref:MBL fold metallo-hydrolase n=1 Tax=Porifericola rhodea TaxID=930972 RepID=UPI002666EB97|nr:MBL fold metallo-hydrolase [Porifericola rhodea]WKN31160.1 MBL fold metallo-hydrolase [Porifericola rhodea]